MRVAPPPAALTDWCAEKMWRTYIMLTDLEAVFRSLKSELGLRPIYHQKQHRSNGHLFITVLAYQLVQVIRRRLREQGEHSSWHTLRSILGGQQRVTCTFGRADGTTLHVRKATRAEPDQRAIYDALGADPEAGGIRKSELGLRPKSDGGRVMRVTSLATDVVPHTDFRSANSFTCSKISRTLLNLG